MSSWCSYSVFSFTTAAWADRLYMMEAQTKEKSSKITQLPRKYIEVPFVMEPNHWSEKLLNQIVDDPDGCRFNFIPDLSILFY